MDAARALEDLIEISSQLVRVAILDRDGSLLASTISEPEAANGFAAGLGTLLEEADRLAPGADPVLQVDVATRDGSVIVMRSDGHVIGATTRPDPTVGLVLYDLRRCLESLEESPTAVASATPATAVKGRGTPRATGARPEGERPA